MNFAALIVLMPIILGPVPAGALKGTPRTEAEKPILSTDGQAIVADMLRRSRSGERVDPSEFDRLLRSDGNKAYGWIDYLAGELSRASGEQAYGLSVEMHLRYLKGNYPLETQKATGG